MGPGVIAIPIRLAGCLLLLGSACASGPVSGRLPVSWISGEPGEPSFQVHAYNDDLYILRQSLATNAEGPFLYLLFGSERVLLQDTGAGGVPVGETVREILDSWLRAHGQASIELVVTHSHAHGDHVAGDEEFLGQPHTTVVGRSVGEVTRFFGIRDWPHSIVPYDLGGGRVIDVIPIPGHHPAHVALYDRRTGLLFTGDTLYPGRLYIADFPAYLESLDRLVAFAEDRPITATPTSAASR
jgi:hydroxyacylglutathione hydrolase